MNYPLTAKLKTWLLAGMIVYVFGFVIGIVCEHYTGPTVELSRDNSKLAAQIATLTTERDTLAVRLKECEAKKIGSAPLGARGPYGGWLDTLTNGKDAVIIIAALLSVDGADNSAERLEAFASALESVEGKTDSKVFKLLNDHVQTCQSNPQCAATLGAVLDHLFVKK